MDITIVPIAAEHIEAFHHMLDVVACEGKYLAFLEAPPLDQVRAFIKKSSASNEKAFAATPSLSITATRT
jgi:hypothetical protein